MKRTASGEVFRKLTRKLHGCGRGCSFFKGQGLHARVLRTGANGGQMHADGRVGMKARGERLLLN